MIQTSYWFSFCSTFVEVELFSGSDYYKVHATFINMCFGDPPTVDVIQVWSQPKGEVEGCGVIERKGDDVDLTLIIIVVLAVVIAILLCLVIGLCVYCCKK